MKSKTGNSAAAGRNVVMADRQWIRRVKQEEQNMIDSYAGPMRDRIEAVRTEQQQNHFYPQT